MKKRGLSAIVTTLMFILLAFVAVGIIWGLVSNIVEKGAEQVDLSSKCLEIDLRITQTECDSLGVCNVTVERKDSGEEIAGVILKFTNSTDSSLFSMVGNIIPLDKKTYRDLDSGMTNRDSIVPIPYFKDELGKDVPCTV